MVKNGELGTVLTGTWLDYDFPIHLGMECHHPNWRTQLTLSFFRGVGQPPTSEQLVKWVNSTENSPEPSNAGQVAGRHAGEQTGGGSARPWGHGGWKTTRLGITSMAAVKTGKTPQWKMLVSMGKSPIQMVECFFKSIFDYHRELLKQFCDVHGFCGGPRSVSYKR